MVRAARPRQTAPIMTKTTIAERIDALPWDDLRGRLDSEGWATTGPLLSAAECDGLVALYDWEDGFRSRVVMARHGLGCGEYRYFDYPLPDSVTVLRASLYPHLAPLTNAWAEALGEEAAYPPDLAAFLDRCRAGGQARPTPLLLRYGPGDFNRLHQDLYGPLAFPIQATILLSDPAVFEGGEFLLVEQRPRMQSRGEVVPLGRGEAVLFCVNRRPVLGKPGFYRVVMRHGVSRLRAGGRHALGIIFHDAT
ncbi:MAG: 2OG-Fe(II) oxygenase [Proteobacteria bacterium]|nr:2OG-Fe(II) oxygenase [Pseudomonadota bacterium]